MFIGLDGYRTTIETDVDSHEDEVKFVSNLMSVIHHGNKNDTAGSILFEAAYETGLLYDLVSLDPENPQYIIMVSFASNLRDVSIVYTTERLQNISDRTKLNLIVSSSTFYNFSQKKENIIAKTFNNVMVKLAKERKCKTRNDVILRLNFE